MPVELSDDDESCDAPGKGLQDQAPSAWIEVSEHQMRVVGIRNIVPGPSASKPSELIVPRHHRAHHSMRNRLGTLDSPQLQANDDRSPVEELSRSTQLADFG